MKQVDARGLSCPQPVIMTKNVMDANEGQIKVLVDTLIASENVQRLAKNKGYQIAIEQDGDDFELILTRQ